MMNRTFPITLLVGALAFLAPWNASAQQIALTGFVKDSLTGEPVRGAHILLTSGSGRTVTDQSGTYALMGSNALRQTPFRADHRLSPVFTQGELWFTVVAAQEPVQVVTCDMSGRMVATVLDRTLAQGAYRIRPFTGSLADRIYCLRVSIGGQCTSLLVPRLGERYSGVAGSLRLGDAAGDISVLARSAAARDTIQVTADGYVSAQRAIESHTGRIDFALLPAGPMRARILFEDASYQGCFRPMVISLEHPGIQQESREVRIMSTSDPRGFTLRVLRQAGAGVFSGSILPSIDASDSARARIKVLDGDTVRALYADPVLQTTDTALVLWSGITGVLQPGMSPYTGLVMPLTINLWDADVTDSLVTVAVSSKADPEGILVSLAAMPGSQGGFRGQVRFSTASVPGERVILVRGTGEESIIMKYEDRTPSRTIQGSLCVWRPFPAVIYVDSTVYHGTEGGMRISLADDDITEDTVVVRVTSILDPVGIIQTLRLVPGYARLFSASTGFSTQQSGTDMIAVGEDDTITVTYQELHPVRTVTHQALWKSR